MNRKVMCHRLEITLCEGITQSIPTITTTIIIIIITQCEKIYKGFMIKV